MAYRRQCRLECAARLLEDHGGGASLGSRFRSGTATRASSPPPFASAFSHSPSEHRALHRDGERGHGRINQQHRGLRAASEYRRSVLIPDRIRLPIALSRPQRDRDGTALLDGMPRIVLNAATEPLARSFCRIAYGCLPADASSSHSAHLAFSVCRRTIRAKMPSFVMRSAGAPCSATCLRRARPRGRPP